MTADPSLAAQSEIRKLARPLGCPPERLSYLAGVPPKDIRALREQLIEMLFSANDSTFKRLAAASRLLPVPLGDRPRHAAANPACETRHGGCLRTRQGRAHL